MLQNDTQMGLLSVLPQCWSAGHGSVTLKLCFFRFFGDPQRGHRVLSLVGGSIYIYISAWWFGPFGLFSHSVGNVKIPTDYIIFFRGGRVETTKQYWFDPHCWSPIFKSHGLTMKQWILPKNWAHFQGIETESFLIKSFSNPNSLRSTTISLYLTSSSSTNASTEGDL